MIGAFVKKGGLLAVVLGFITAPCRAQSIPVGSAADQYLRFLQLTGQTSNNSSLVSRPLTPDRSEGGADSAINGLLRSALHFAAGKNSYVGVLPLAWDQQFVTHHPFYQNDGAMIPAKGYQLQGSGGVYGKAGPLSFQFKPELIYAADRPYKHNTEFGSVPKGSYRKIYAGQSFVSLHAGPVALSVATENLWWGPGIHHSLLMSNQAPGFLHVKVHSHKPLKTPIGQFEWAMIGGRLTSEPNLAFDNAFMRYNNTALASDRYLNAYVISYQPKFLSGFSVGVSRAMQQYELDIKSSGESLFRKYLPVVLKPVQKKNAWDDDAKNTDQVASAFFRWLWKRSHAEIYGEYGFNDYKANIRDYVMNLPHSAAYLFGFKKAFPMQDNEFVEAGVEIVQMRQSLDQLVRDAGNWYEHGGIWEGYTNHNQVMGAAFASNAQTFQLIHHRGIQRTVLTLQRYQRDPDRSSPFWNDWVVGFSHARPFKGFYLEGQLQCISSRNYTWERGNNPIQWLARTGIRYYFHD